MRAVQSSALRLSTVEKLQAPGVPAEGLAVTDECDDYADLDLPPAPRWWTTEFFTTLAVIAVMTLGSAGLILLLMSALRVELR
jgi:hypothetical protein